MNFETELTIVNEKLNNAEKFNGHVENSKHDLNNEFDNLVTQYQKLNVRLTEFEDLINRVNQDKAIIKDIEDFLGEKSEQENQKYQLGDYEKLKEFRLNIAKISSLNKTVVQAKLIVLESYIIKQFKEQVVEVEASPENKIDNELEQKSPEKIDEDKIEEEPIEQVDQKEEECVVEKVDAEVEAPKIPKIAIEESDKEESKSFVLIFNDLMDLKIEAGGVMRSIKREKMKVDENLSKSLESSYEFYSAFKKEIDEHLANKVFDLTSYKIFKVTEFEKLYKGCVDISKEIDDWGEQLKKKKL